jgi:hypothetical protein
MGGRSEGKTAPELERRFDTSTGVRVSVVNCRVLVEVVQTGDDEDRI